MGCTASTPTAQESFAAGEPAIGEWSTERLQVALDKLGSSVAEATSRKLLPPSPLPAPPAGDGHLAAMGTWDFDVFGVPHGQLPAFAYSVLASHPTFATGPLARADRRKLWRYVREVARWYHARPFHSFRHAVDVLLAAANLLRMVREDHPGALDVPLLAGCTLVSALVHDADHPGVMNTYLNATGHVLATSREAWDGANRTAPAVLETHHANVALALLERPELDFTAPLNGADRARFRAQLRTNVLNTDVTTTVPKSREFKQASFKRPSVTVTSFNKMVNNGNKSELPPDELILCLIIKAADISNPTRSLAVYEKWIERVMQEFFVQGDAELARDLPISMNCDRTAVKVPNCQVGFITFLVRPLFEALVNFSPSMRPLLAQMVENLAHMQTLASAAETAAKPPERLTSTAEDES